MSKNFAGIITIDINGKVQPNILYKKQFHILISLNGIDYEQFYLDTSMANNEEIEDNGDVENPSLDDWEIERGNMLYK